MELYRSTVLFVSIFTSIWQTTSSSSIYSYSKEVKVQIGKDFDYQLNCTKTIKEVKWGLFRNYTNVLDDIFYNGNMQNPNLPALYKGRLEYFGDYRNGRVWYRIKNVTLGHSGYYGVSIRPDDGSGASYLKTHLIVTTSSSSIYSYPKEVNVQVGKDFDYQLNCTKTIREVSWGLLHNDTYRLHYIFYYGNQQNPTLPALYRGRLEYFGDWKNGRVWYRIKNVTLGDSGYYRVSIRLDDGSALSYLKTHLIVTKPPIFTAKPYAKTPVIEHRTLTIVCSAIGPPQPTIKWLNVTASMATVTQGKGSSVLTIPRISRHYNGQTYVCQADNNPNEQPSKTTTEIQVYNKPMIDMTSSSTTTASWEGNVIKLVCKLQLDGNSQPTWKWYHPNGEVITGSKPIDQGSELTVKTGPCGCDYGIYRCEASNIAGRTTHSIHVIRKVLFPPGPPDIFITNIDSSSAEIHWTEPSATGGSHVTGYKLTVDNQTYGLSADSLTKSVSGLENGLTYKVQVWAKNDLGFGNAAVHFFSTTKGLKGSCSSSQGLNATSKDSNPVTFSVLLAFSLILNIAVILAFGYFMWRYHRGQKKSSNRREHQANDQSFTNCMVLEDKAPTNRSTVYENVGNQGQHQSSSPGHNQSSANSDTYSSLSPKTRLPPKPAIITDSGHHQSVQDPNSQYQPLSTSRHSRRI